MEPWLISIERLRAIDLIIDAGAHYKQGEMIARSLKI